MEALKIAFDIIIVGALALPSVFFADLFFLTDPKDDNKAKRVWDFVTRGVPTALAGVMLFGVTYLLGSAISRTAEDFFNDDDLIRRLWPTEDNIRTAEYCDQDRKIRDTLKEIIPDFDKCPRGRRRPRPRPRSLSGLAITSSGVCATSTPNLS